MVRVDEDPAEPQCENNAQGIRGSAGASPSLDTMFLAAELDSNQPPGSAEPGRRNSPRHYIAVQYGYSTFVDPGMGIL
jgi:hypothetical protein